MGDWKRWAVLVVGAVLGLTTGANDAWATAYFEIDVANSSVTLTDQSGGGIACRRSSCGIEAQLASDFGGDIVLHSGETWDFDFIEFTADGSAGLLGRSFEIQATLAFAEPTGIETTSSGSGRGFFLAGVITGGVLTWDDLPQSFGLEDGSVAVVDFEDGISILPLSRSVVTGASVSLRGAATPVPEPSAALLFATGSVLVARRTAARRSRSAS